MELKTYYQSLNDAEKNQFASQSGYQRMHIETHLIRAYKVPRRDMMPRLYLACNGNVSWDELLDHFYSGVKPDENGSSDNPELSGCQCDTTKPDSKLLSDERLAA